MIPAAETDEALVTRCVSGDAAAWDALVDRHGAVVWAVARRAGLGHEDAQDVFQNTWRTALEELARLRAGAAVGGWLARIARHQSMRVRRGYGIARKSREHVAREDRDETLPDADLERIEERARVQTAMSRIGDRCRRLLSLLYESDPARTYDEIAREMSMRIGSIGPTRARCLEKLTTALDDAASDEAGARA